MKSNILKMNKKNIEKMFLLNLDNIQMILEKYYQKLMKLLFLKVVIFNKYGLNML